MELVCEKEVVALDTVAAGRKGVVYNKNRTLVANEQGARE